MLFGLDLRTLASEMPEFHFLASRPQLSIRQVVARLCRNKSGLQHTIIGPRGYWNTKAG